MSSVFCNNAITPETLIENLGPCKFPSPLKKLHFSEELFKTDSDRILADITFAGAMKAAGFSWVETDHHPKKPWIAVTAVK